MHLLPTLAKHVLGKPLFLYLSISDVAVNTTIVEDEANTLLFVYYVIKLFYSPEKKYIEIEKHLYALNIVA